MHKLLTQAQISTLREMSSYKAGYPFRQATCRTLVALGFAEVMDVRKRPRHLITAAGREALFNSLPDLMPVYGSTPVEE